MSNAKLCTAWHSTARRAVSASRTGNYTTEVIQICHVYAYSDIERKLYELSNFLTFALSPFLGHPTEYVGGLIFYQGFFLLSFFFLFFAV